MSYVLSEPIETLIQDQPCGAITEKHDQNTDDKPPDKPLAVDVLIVGSGYGGAIAAMRLAGLKPNVYVFERGN